MRRQLTYEDAVRILGGGEHKLLKYLDRGSMIGLLAAGGFDFLDIREQFVRLGGELITKLSERLRGIDRLTRAERLVAAHHVIVITAYFDALGDVLDRFGPVDAPRITAADQLSITSGEPIQTTWAGVLNELQRPPAGDPWSLTSNEATQARLSSYYGQLNDRAVRFMSGLGLAVELDETRRELFLRDLTDLRMTAIAKYDELFRRLVVDSPEFAVWVGLAEHRATRDQVRSGLSALEGLLGQIASGALPDARRAALSKAYQAKLGKSITAGGDLSAGLHAPTLGAGYVDHRFQVAVASGSSGVGRESFWQELPTRGDIHTFLATYLSSPEALQTPLLVLGQPGSGKSVLTRVLAARLPATDFLPVRVELRQVPAEADLQDQIELAVRQETGENVSWPRLVESAPGALPVVLLDGFDELLQATGISQTDFLVKAAVFQDREADQGRPVAVIVTSRIAVANRAALPQDTVVMRLVPFDDHQIAAWLDIWHRTNGAALTERGLRELPIEVVLQHRELAEQPLLLLMLALHDASANALQHRTERGQLSRTRLYEQLLTDFARREVVKQPGGMSEAELDRAVETELLRLAVVAFAMFNRRSQWIGESELNRDLAALLGDHTDARNPNGRRAPLTAAQIVVGRFFFVHEAKATRDGQELQSYEFLHATFGEFLVARLTAHVLTDLVKREAATTRLLPGGIDDGLLHALLSFAALTARAPVVTFLSDLLGQLTETQRAVAKDIMLRLHRTALHSRAESAYAAYEPGGSSLADRLAVWSANLVLLAVVTGGEVTGDELFPDSPEELAHRWRDEAMMWRARLSSEEWSGLIATIAVRRVWVGERRDVRLSLEDGTFTPEWTDLRWTYNVAPGDSTSSAPVRWAGHMPERLDRKANFTAGKSNDMMSHALEPVGYAFPSLANTLFPVDSGRLVSATHALLTTLFAPVRGNDAKSTAYSDLVAVARRVTVLKQFNPEYEGFLKAAMAVLWLAKHNEHLPSVEMHEFDRLLEELS